MTKRNISEKDSLVLKVTDAEDDLKEENGGVHTDKKFITNLVPKHPIRKLSFETREKSADLENAQWTLVSSDIGPAVRIRGTSHVSVDRDEKMVIRIKLVFLKIADIDTANENFMSDVFIQAKWREPMLDGCGKTGEYDMEYCPDLWEPKLSIENARGDLNEYVWHIVRFNSKGEATIQQRRRVKGTFFERMELNQFPFDQQDLSVCIMSERSIEEVALKYDETEVSSVNVSSFADEQQWNLHAHINHHYVLSNPNYNSSQAKHPMLYISCLATRRAEFFIWNILIVMVLLGAVSFTTFVLDVDNPYGRLQLSFILLLSNITFKFSATSNLPRVPYLTYLDKYILISMGLLCSLCIWHAIIGHVINIGDTKEFHHWLDDLAAIAFGSIYILFNVTFGCWCTFMVRRRQRVLSIKDNSIAPDKINDLIASSPDFMLNS